MAHEAKLEPQDFVDEELIEILAQRRAQRRAGAQGAPEGVHAQRLQQILEAQAAARRGGGGHSNGRTPL